MNVITKKYSTSENIREVSFTLDPLISIENLNEPHCFFKPIPNDLGLLERYINKHIWVIDRNKKKYQKVLIKEIFSLGGNKSIRVLHSLGYTNSHPESYPMYKLDKPEELLEVLNK